MVRRLRRALKREGITGVLRGVSRRIRTPRARSLKICQELVGGKKGIEIGGPSAIFRRSGLLPIYPISEHLDNCNFSANTVWEGRIREGFHFRYSENHPPGYQYLREAIELTGIPPASYDFILSSHVLEHLANPLRALQEWKRLLRPNGVLVLVVPHKDGTFDHRRPVTPFRHLLRDFELNVAEDDTTHLPEILQLHDLEMDPEAGSFEDFSNRSQNNFLNRCLHHHVFDTRLVLKVMDHAGFRICAVEPVRPFHIIALGQMEVSGRAPDNGAFLAESAAYRDRSPFRSDRVRG